MNLKNKKFFLITIGTICLLLIATPLIYALLPSLKAEKYSELSLLGSQHTADGYPTAIKVGEKTSQLYVEVTNNMGSSQFYMLCFKLANLTDPQPDTRTGSSSTLKPLLTQRLAVEADKTMEIPLTFSILSGSNSSNIAIINSIEINSQRFNIDKTVAIYGNDSHIFYYRLIVELWIYNTQTQVFEYNNRFIYLQFQMSS